MATTRLDLQEAATSLPKYVSDLKPGDRIILCHGNNPVAEILPLPAAQPQPRPIGLGAGLATVPDSFFDPLPEDLLDAFEGKTNQKGG